MSPGREPPAGFREESIGFAGASLTGLVARIPWTFRSPFLEGLLTTLPIFYPLIHKIGGVQSVQRDARIAGRMPLKMGASSPARQLLPRSEKPAIEDRRKALKGRELASPDPSTFTHGGDQSCRDRFFGHRDPPRRRETGSSQRLSQVRPSSSPTAATSSAPWPSPDLIR